MQVETEDAYISVKMRVDLQSVIVILDTTFLQMESLAQVKLGVNGK